MRLLLAVADSDGNVRSVHASIKRTAGDEAEVPIPVSGAQMLPDSAGRATPGRRVRRARPRLWIGRISRSARRSMHVGALACLLATLEMPTAAAIETRRVLELHSSSRFLPANVERERALQAVLESVPGRRTEVFSEFLDIPRFQGDAYARIVATFLHDKYLLQPPD